MNNTQETQFMNENAKPPQHHSAESNSIIKWESNHFGSYTSSVAALLHIGTHKLYRYTKMTHSKMYSLALGAVDVPLKATV